jgi:hypothetical protein
MENIYNNHIEEYRDLPYAFYESEFVPFIMTQLQLNNLPMLSKIFGFIERLFSDGDEMTANLAEVAIVESLFFENDYSKYENMILSLCGEKTRKSFEDCSI